MPYPRFEDRERASPGARRARPADDGLLRRARQARVRPPGRVPRARRSSPRTSSATPRPRRRGPRGTRRRRAAPPRCALRHAVFVDEQGVPVELERRRPRRRGDAPRRASTTTARSSATCRLLSRHGATVQLGRLAVDAARAAPGDRAALLREAARGSGRAARRTPHRAAARRPTRSALYVARRLQRASGEPFLEAGHRARRRWRSTLPEVRVDPLTGLRAIVAGDAPTRPGGGPRVEPAGADRPRARPVRSRATRTARRPRSARCARRRRSPTRPAGRVRVVPNLYPALTPGRARPRAATPRPTSSPRCPRAAPTR